LDLNEDIVINIIGLNFGMKVYNMIKQLKEKDERFRDIEIKVNAKQQVKEIKINWENS